MKILTTFGVGPAREALAISLPFMQAYAARHGYRLIVPSDEEVKALGDGRPPSWAKIPWLSKLCEETPFGTQVLWLDADVIVARHDVDIGVWPPEDKWGQPWVSMVVQEVPDGSVPSCGVMLFRNDGWCRSRFNFIWYACGPDGMGSARSAGWWEQAAMIRYFGGDPDRHPIVPPREAPFWQEPYWGKLGYEWNPHPADPRGVPEDCRFFHATGIADRLGAMREWAAKVRL